MKRVLLTALALSVQVMPALAGMPVETELTCPVGGEKFTITETLSCSDMGVTMSLMSVTSCDFVTRLPVCPSNGLPLYREFGEADIGRLSALVQSEEYRSLQAQPSYLRAYGVAGHLGEAGTDTAYWLLQQGLWYEREGFADVPGAFDWFVSEADQRKHRVAPEEKPYFLAAVAYQLALEGRDGEALGWLGDAREASDGSEFLRAYIKAVANCVGRMTSEECGPDAPFNP
jgi:hypothetical protein